MATKKSIIHPDEYETRLNEVLTTLKQKINTCVQSSLQDTPESSYPLCLITSREQARINKFNNYLEKNIYSGLGTLCFDGTHGPSPEFSPTAFEILLRRTSRHKLPLHSFQINSPRGFWDAWEHTMYNTTPDDPRWYFTAFSRSQSLNIPFTYEPLFLNIFKSSLPANAQLNQKQ